MPPTRNTQPGAIRFIHRIRARQGEPGAPGPRWVHRTAARWMTAETPFARPHIRQFVGLLVRCHVNG